MTEAAHPGAGEAQKTPCTPHVQLRRAEIVVNPKSGGVGPKAAFEAEQLLETFDLEANIVEADPPRVVAAIEAALAAKPDLVVVVAGDGTARTAASLAGANGPLIAPLPGGTMNMLPKALYGTADWREALTLALTEGEERRVAGGRVGGEPFYVAAILGSPALWAPAREALREGKAQLAYLYAKRAMRKAFSRRLRFTLDGQFHKAEALALLSPMVSKAMDDAVALEAAILDPHRAGEVFRLAARAMVSDWRDDPSVTTVPIQQARAWAQDRIPVLLDGEPTLMERAIDISFEPCAFRALAPKPQPVKGSA
jgi:diacylglycerol kinase family enzyme